MAQIISSFTLYSKYAHDPGEDEDVDGDDDEEDDRKKKNCHLGCCNSS